jgi:hypothetical protein
MVKEDYNAASGGARLEQQAAGVEAQKSSGRAGRRRFFAGIKASAAQGPEFLSVANLNTPRPGSQSGNFLLPDRPNNACLPTPRGYKLDDDDGLLARCQFAPFPASSHPPAEA